MLIADLHIHSKYSRATSEECVPEYLELWARKKGVGLLGTGDFTHPAWRAELREKLVEAEDGLYALRPGAALAGGGGAQPPRFVVSGEISCIYKKRDKVRKVHNLLLLPSLDAAEELSHRLEAIGNIRSDGRPILGLDSRDLLEITLEACPDALFIPAHIWTPHFSMFGAFSGFDTLEECFGDLSGHIRAVETGLSSDPPMNWRLSALDGLQLLSHSDAHSPAKLGREADLLDVKEPSYGALARAVNTGEGLAGTLEFYPEEGKYHLDGHRNCGQCLTPAETAAAGGRCPACGRRVTIGVLHRVEELADRAEGYVPAGARPFESLVSLPEVIAASTGGAAAGKKTRETYEAMLQALGPEFHILREAPLEDIRHAAGPCVEEGIRRLRAGKVERSAGYDGAYGKITLLGPAEREALNGQVSLFGADKPAPRKRAAGGCGPEAPREAGEAPAAPSPRGELNGAQRAAVEADERAVAVTAGPGTGKTKTLAARIARLIRDKGVKPGEITAVTFTNRAAGELRERLERELGGRRAVRGLTVGTFHAICLELLARRPQGARLADRYEAGALAEAVLKGRGLKTAPEKLLQAASRVKNGLGAEGFPEEIVEEYCLRLGETGALDFDDLLLEALRAAEEAPDGALRPFTHLLADEFQDSSPVQYALVKAWNRRGKSLFVIGDADQSIYGFRGADAGCFDRLEADFPGLRRITLTKNYRSTPEILACALPVIDGDGGPPRRLEAVRAAGAPVRLVTAESPLSEAVFVAREIGRAVGGIDMLAAGEREAVRAARSFSDIAVLYRTHRQAETLEKCLAREGIPCVVAGRDGFLADRAVRGAAAFFRSLLDPADAGALRACLDLAFGCPADIADGAAAVWGAAPGGALERVGAVGAAFPQAGRLPSWRALAERLTPQAGREKPRRLLEAYAQALSLTASEPMNRFMNMAVFHGSMAAFLENLALGREGDLLRGAGMSYAAGYVTLMTFHGSKGLEFPLVFLCGANRGLVPYESEQISFF